MRRRFRETLGFWVLKCLSVDFGFNSAPGCGFFVQGQHSCIVPLSEFVYCTFKRMQRDSVNR
jgi:hypothetical protein